MFEIFRSLFKYALILKIVLTFLIGQIPLCTYCKLYSNTRCARYILQQYPVCRFPRSVLFSVQSCSLSSFLKVLCWKPDKKKLNAAATHSFCLLVNLYILSGGGGGGRLLVVLNYGGWPHTKFTCGPGRMMIVRQTCFTIYVLLGDDFKDLDPN